MVEHSALHRTDHHHLAVSVIINCTLSRLLARPCPAMCLACLFTKCKIQTKHEALNLHSKNYHNLRD